jgi:HEAT repeat protein
MGDGSEYVRGNAAWAIGELADKPGGREAAADALGDLHRLQESDPSPDVRRAAEAALKKLQ